MKRQALTSQLLRILLSISIAIPSFSAGNGQGGNPNDPASIFGRAVGANKGAMSAAEKAGQEIAAGRFDNVNYDKDIFHVAGGLSKEGQTIQITGRENYSLNQAQSEIPPVSFSALKVRFDAEKRTLVFEAYMGQNEDGEGGSLVATHTIPNLDIKALIRDNEILQFVDSKGRLNAIPMDVVTSHVFNRPIPIIKNLWDDKATDSARSTYSLKLGSVGMKPPASIGADVVVPLDKNGNPDIKAGDLWIYKNEKLLGIFSRLVTYQQIESGLQNFIRLGTLIFPANVDRIRLQALIDDLQKLEQLEEAEAAAETVPPLVRDALLHFNEQRMKSLDASRAKQQERAGRQFQRLDDLERWETIYQQIVARAESQENELRNKLGKKPKNLELKKKADAIRKSLETGDFSTTWQDRYAPKQVSSVTEMVREYSVPVAFVLGTVAAFGFVGIYEHSQTLRDMQAATWMYQQIPDVVRDEAYRHPLLYGTLAVLALWPAGEIAGAAFARGMRLLAHQTRNLNTRMSRRIQDISRVWGDLNRWQVLTTTGARIRAVTTSPIPRAVISSVLGQRSMITAWNNNLSPWKKIAPESREGKTLGLKKPILIGVGPRNQNNLRLRAQALVAERRDRANSLALQIATLVVGESEQIDPASIMMLLQGETDLTKLDSIFSDPKLNRIHKLTQEKLAKHLNAIDDGFFDGDITDESSTKLNEYIEVAKHLAQQIKGTSKVAQVAKTAWSDTRKFLKSKRNMILNLGYADSLFLKSIVTNKFVSEQTKRAFIPDHIMVAVIFALYGDRANLAKPQDLAADPNGALWTSPPHWSDVGSNTNAHWFSAAARKALIYQSVRPLDSEEYVPFEYALVNTADRSEPFTKSFAHWFRVFDPRQSDIGTTAMTGFQKSLTTIQAAWLTNMAFRMGLGNQSMSEATAGFLLMLFASQWTYGFPWDFIEKGNYIEGHRIDGMKAEFAAAMTSIANAMHEKNPSTAAEQARQGADALIKLYEKYNPKALRNMEASPELAKYLGLAAKLRLAISTGDESLITKAKTETVQALTSGGFGTPELEVMNAKALYDYALQTTPIYTEAHWATAWVSTTVFGAILTTLLAIPLSVSSFHVEWDTVAMWAAGSTAAYFAYYKALKQDGWVAKGLNRIQSYVKSLRAKRTTQAPAIAASPAAASEAQVLQGLNKMCDSILKGR